MCPYTCLTYLQLVSHSTVQLLGYMAIPSTQQLPRVLFRLEAKHSHGLQLLLLGVRISASRRDSRASSHISRTTSTKIPQYGKQHAVICRYAQIAASGSMVGHPYSDRH